jgi:hypothetical protein
MIPIRCSLLAVLAVALCSVPTAWAENPKPAKPDPGMVEIRFADGTKQKVKLLDQKIEFTTPYGKLTVPATDILGLELMIRIPEEVAKQIDKAITDLGNSEFQVREDATAALVKLGARAYPAVTVAAKSNDPEVQRRAESVLEKLKKSLPADMLQARKHDLIVVPHSTIAGRVEAAALQVRTAEGKEKEVKLADVRNVRSPAYKAQLFAATDVRPDPGTAQALGGAVGTSYYVRVTGNTGGSLWGSGVYTNDSSIAKAAVHAGVLKDGETGVVKVTIVAPQAAYQGETRNGVTSAAYGPWPGAYTVEKADLEND